MMVGTNRLTKAVAATLGPKGRNVVLGQSFGAPQITKDGVTVAKTLEFTDRVENIAASLIKEVASKTNDIAGDGTTTSTILANAMFREGSKAVAAGMNPMDLKRGMDAAVKHMVVDLEAQAKKISNSEEISQVATIAANGDKTIGNLIAQAFDKVSTMGTITVADGTKLEHELEVVEGMKFDSGYISPQFITDQKTRQVNFTNPLILFYDKKISSVQSIVPVLECVAKLPEKRPLLVIAENIEDEALTTLVLNKLRGGLQVAAVKAPGFGDQRTAMIQDLAVLCGGEMISEDTGRKLDENFEFACFGSAKTVNITKDDTTILHGAGSLKDIAGRCRQIQSIMETTTSEYEREKLNERVSKLAGGVAVIKVGASSEVEAKEIKDRIEDALNATRAAVVEGTVPGGGVALLYSAKALEGLELSNFDQNMGRDIVKKAASIPLTILVDNSGKDGCIVAEHLLNQPNRQLG